MTQIQGDEPARAIGSLVKSAFTKVTMTESDQGAGSD